MAGKPVLLDRWGHPVQRSALLKPAAAATLGGVRSPLSGYPGDGLDPLRLAAILREADAGDPVRYLELAETIEERNEHYLGILGTRKRSVSQLDITVTPGGESQFDLDRAAEVRTWLERDELADELFDILDAIGKGYSFTEIMWDSSEGSHEPAWLERRDPRWFTFDRVDLATPRQLDSHGQPQPLPGYKFIFARIAAKSGLPGRSGLARVAAWNWMFKAFTARDWAIFSQTYGQPLRLGKWDPSASEADKETLFRAVANIAGDCAATIPASMQIEFIETGNLAAGSDLYLKRADWLDQQMSKAVLGQTATTDAIAGGHAVGREHRQVQEDIEVADAKALAAHLNRDLIRPWMRLNWGELPAYPRIHIGRAEPEDLEQLTRSLSVLVPLGFLVAEEEVRAKLGLRAPKAGERVLGMPAAPPPGAEDPAGAGGGSGAGAFESSGAIFERATTPTRGREDRRALQSEMALSGPISGASAEDLLADRLEREAAPAMAGMMRTLEAMVEAAGSLEELREMMLAGFDRLDEGPLAAALGEAMVAAMVTGRLEVAAEGADG